MKFSGNVILVPDRFVAKPWLGLMQPLFQMGTLKNLDTSERLSPDVGHFYSLGAFEQVRTRYTKSLNV
ncbi:hypothetical protein NUH86_08955 [Sphingobium sp. JS3065]|uniref:hypothetical protein n=1 Tax=Sphingobium sp. JS3065 TaxID=2970925 RepID=UPI00226549E9|nr:hypothetical protein [Sphingobium sp. JS3065]UZW53690.1 hypothetical protein NUH86_08955 [Sphingobium sp. JS3065]